MVEITVEFDDSGLSRLTDRLEAELAKAVAASAFVVEDLAKMNAPVDTGALQASLYTRTAAASGFSDSVLASSARRPGTEFVREAPRPASSLEAIVAAGVHYATYVEFGTARMAGRYFLRRAGQEAVSQIRDLFARAMRKATKEAMAGTKIKVRL